MDPVDSSLPYWEIDVSDELLHKLRPCLIRFWDSRPAGDPDHPRPDKERAIPLVEVASFFNFLDQDEVDRDLVLAIVRSFHGTVLSDMEIHTLATRLDGQARDNLLEAYFRVCNEFRPASPSGLLSAAKYGHASMLAIFGGQGMHNPTGLDDLRTIYRTYKPLVEEFITSAGDRLMNVTARLGASHHFGPYGFDLALWVQQPNLAPSTACLATAPFSFPINGLISFAHYCVACRTMGLQPGELRDLLTGVTGHSQGIIVAAAVAGSNSWADLLNAVEDAMELLFWLGWESHYATPSCGDLALLNHSGSHRQLFATSMLSVRGMKRSALERVLEDCNNHLGVEEKVYLALANASDSMVVSGPTQALSGLRAILEMQSASSDANQDKIPYLERLPVIDCQFLPVSAAFHSAHLEGACDRVINRIGSTGLLDGLDLKIPVYHTFTGEDIQVALCQHPLPILIRAVLCEPVDWLKACTRTSTTHILDFGPGRTSTLAQEHIIGSGRRIILASEYISSPAIGGKQEIFALKPPIFNPDWGKIYAPTLLTERGHRTTLKTRMTQVLGVPPIMVAGMTPTTVDPEFVACVMGAGFHIELACGGYSRAPDLQQAIHGLSSMLPRGRNITLNVIYANPRAISWQIPLIRRLRSEGYPIEGLCIGAGVPSPDVAKEYIDTLGLKHIAFKPSSVNSIQQVLEIAKNNPSTPILLQWTGGRAGGHHSYDDFYEPLLRTYSTIRQHGNIILVAGSGLGDAHGIMPLLTGDWAVSRGYSRMPVDGVLLGSRMMVAKEARTSLAVKKLIVDTPGVMNEEWHESYARPIGGIVTVRSEMGEPIHKIANRAVLLWHDLDKTLFNIKDVEKRAQSLRRRRAEIISRLNNDYAKPWFAMNSSGKPVELEDMTYAECLQRITTLMYIHQKQEWVHDSYRIFFLDVVNRVQERFGMDDELILDQYSSPFDLLDRLFTVCPAAIVNILYPEDVSFFLGLCKRRGQKPVNFIPTLDADFETWFKKDSLWQMENLEAVVDQDAQRVCIIHGPVAAQFSTSFDEPAADILNNILSDLVKEIESIEPTHGPMNIDEDRVWINVQSSRPSTELDFVDLTTSETQQDIRVDCRFKQPVPSGGARLLLQKLGIGAHHWLSICLNDETVFVDHHRKPNRVRNAFVPRAGDRLTIEYRLANKDLLSASFFECALDQLNSHPAFTLTSADGEKIRFDMMGPKPIDAMVTFNLRLKSSAGQQYLHDMMPSHGANMRQFYASCWSLNNHRVSADTISAEFTTESLILTTQLVDDFVSLISRAKGNHTGTGRASSAVPLDIGIVVAWKSLSRPLLLPDLGGDLSRLLHLSNAFEMIPGEKPLCVGDSLQTTSRITAITIKPQGKLVEVTAVVGRTDRPVMRIRSEFLMQGQFPEDHLNFRHSDVEEWKLSLASPKLVALLQSRQWFSADQTCPELLGQTLLFQITVQKSHIQSSNSFALHSSGTVFIAGKGPSSSPVGHVLFSHESCSGDPVTDFLQRYGTSTRQEQPLEHPGWYTAEPLALRVCDLGREYSALSTDHNPIHVSRSFAGFSGLSSTIVHGMYTSAVVRSKVEEHLMGRGICGFRRWATTFEDVVCDDDILLIDIHHSGMAAGNMLLDIQVWNKSSNIKVLTAEAEVEQARTAYLFCGQGSQKKDMGMALYNVDDVAKSVWDRGERYLFDLYGFSILDIIRNNPTKLTVHFGTKRGRQIRANYLSLTRNQAIGNVELTVPVISGLNEQSNSITFEEPSGLLFSTQFAQPLISLLNVAEMAALESRGLVQEGSVFAGHSLGEYSALLACSGFMSLENLLSLTFYRGLVMQYQMSQDSAGRTEFSMAAVNPSRVYKGFDERSLKNLVNVIARTTGLLLEVVNYNVAGQQYVCAGHLRSLWVLQKACDDLSSSPQPQSFSAEDIQAVIDRHAAAAIALRGPVQLERGRATIPLPGVNVPFHSSYLRGGIPVYRQYLQNKIRQEDIAVERLVGRYIPNLTGKPFEVTREYVEEVAKVTESKALNQLLMDWVY